MSVQPQHTTFPSTDGKHQLALTTWSPQEPPRGVVQIVHGMREHMGRYNDFANFLCSHGFLVCGHDHLGHGKTVSFGDTYGYFGKDYGAGFLVDDSAAITKELARSYPKLPLFLLGHSMGSFIARLQILQIGSLLQGFICMGTGGPNVLAPYARAGVAGTIKLKGGKFHCPIADGVLDRISSRNLSKGEPVDAWVSHDPATVRNFMQDPYSQFHFTLQGYADLLDLQIASNRKQWFEKVPKQLPILLVSGKEDPVGRNGHDISKIFRELTNRQVEDVRYIIYRGMRHEILNEIENQRVYKDLLRWVQSKMITDNF